MSRSPFIRARNSHLGMLHLLVFATISVLTPGMTRAETAASNATEPVVSTIDSLANPPILLDSLRAATSADSLRHDSLRSTPVKPVRDTVIVPDSTWRWPANKRIGTCTGPLETLAQCWRLSESFPTMALQETGFPGIRAIALNLRGLEPAGMQSFFQPALAQSPYGTGGHAAFAHYESDLARGLALEAWTPVQPLDTPVTDLRWMRGALLMNQFGFTLHRMVGNRAYVGFDYLSNGSEGMFYDYAFQVHQPYLSAGRDSLSLVIEDTSHSVSSRHVRPRVGFWLNENTVAEFWADWLSNSTDLANPTNTFRNDSVQWLFPASYSATTFGGLIARASDDHTVNLTFRHSSWERALAPGGDSARVENATGQIDALDAAWTFRRLPGEPRLSLVLENTIQSGAFRLKGTDGKASSSAFPAATGARGDREIVALDARPHWGGEALGAGVDLRGEAGRRARPDGVVETPASFDADGRLHLPWGFSLTGGGAWARTGAPDDLLFRWQPAQGLYPNPDLTPRTHTRYGAGARWESRHIGFGAAYEQHRFENTWLPRILPSPNTCVDLLDSLSYTRPGDINAGCLGESLPDSFALAHVNYAEETREQLHLTGFVAAGNWRLTLRNTSLIKNTIRDPHLGIITENYQIPLNVLTGQLFWKRVVLDGKLGLQTRWDWEWYSARYEFASDGDGSSRVVPLDEYLALDFTTQMDIRSFSLYFRAMNLFHDRYSTEPGVHPPGINFRFGVNWRLRN